MNACAPHRDFLVAIADGETALVPAATLDHVKGCTECAGRIRAHQMLSARLREASDRLIDTTSTRRRLLTSGQRLRAITAAAAGAILIAAGSAGWFVFTRPDPVEAAATASSQPLQIESTDSSQVGQWCLRASGRELPEIQLDGMQVVGARMDRIASTDIVTLFYMAPSGTRVTVSWLEGQALSGSGVEDRKVSGHELLVVHSALGTAVILSPSSEAMWQTAAAIESGGV